MKSLIQNNIVECKLSFLKLQVSEIQSKRVWKNQIVQFLFVLEKQNEAYKTIKTYYEVIIANDQNVNLCRTSKFLKIILNVTYSIKYNG